MAEKEWKQGKKEKCDSFELHSITHRSTVWRRFSLPCCYGSNGTSKEMRLLELYGLEERKKIKYYPITKDLKNYPSVAIWYVKSSQHKLCLIS